jgi:hypothetical protein
VRKKIEGEKIRVENLKFGEKISAKCTGYFFFYIVDANNPSSALICLFVFFFFF